MMQGSDDWPVPAPRRPETTGERALRALPAVLVALAIGDQQAITAEQWQSGDGGTDDAESTDDADTAATPDADATVETVDAVGEDAAEIEEAAVEEALASAAEDDAADDAEDDAVTDADEAPAVEGSDDAVEDPEGGAA